jgi:hypothetical protein
MLAHYGQLNCLLISLYSASYSNSTDFIMPLTKSTVIFKEVNENTSKCSAWLQEKDRCCQRTIVTADQQRKEMLLQSITRRNSQGEELDELAGLYFCNGWHRPGGRCAISSSQTRKLLQNLFPSIPERRTRYPLATWRLESPVSSLDIQEAALMREFAEFSFSARQPTPHPFQHNASDLSEVEILSLSTTQSRAQPHDHDSFELSEEDRLSFTTAESDIYSSQQDTSELSEAEILSFSIANLTLQYPELDVSTFSAPQQLQQASNSLEPNLENLPRYPLLPSTVEENRQDRSIEPDKNCQICLLALTGPTEVSRCKFCYTEVHLDCMVEWLTASGSNVTCIDW